MNIKYLQNKCLNYYPWIKSREILFFKVFIELLIIVIFSFSSKNFIKLDFNFIISTSIFLILWISICYVLGRFENNIRNKNSYLSKELKILINIFFLAIIFNKLITISSSKNNFILGLTDILLIIVSSFICQFIINNKIFEDNSGKENWYFISNSLKNTQINDLLKYSRIKLKIKSIKLDQIKSLKIEKIDGIIINDIKNILKAESKLIYDLKLNNVKILSSLEWAGTNLQRFPSELISEDDSMIEKLFFKVNTTPFKIRLKRVSEFFISLILLIFCIPVLVISGVLIKLEDGGPIFYSQLRTGFRGEVFKIYKLRTMKINSEKDGPVWSKKNDKRITRVGGFLRKSRIDELPQLLLVINGKLSLIGPRPERPDFDNLFREEIPNYDLRYLMKPGLSGWAQVNYPYGASKRDAQNKLSYDLYYILNFSTFFDFLILLKTIKLVFNRKGAIAQN